MRLIRTITTAAALTVALTTTGCTGPDTTTAPTTAATAASTTATTASPTPSPTDSPTPSPTTSTATAASSSPSTTKSAPAEATTTSSPGTALAALEALEVKGRAPKTGYDRDQFGPAWADTDRNGCDTRNDILARDLKSETFKPGTQNCVVLTGALDDPYTATEIHFRRGQDTSTAVQIDHVVALSDAWQKGAQQLTAVERTAFANDPLNLLAVDGPTNAQKGDSDAATESRPGTDRDWAAVEQALTAGRGVVVTNAEALDRRSRTRLQQSSATALEAGSTARVLLTEQLQEQNSGSIVPTVSGGAGTTEGTVEVTVPSLAELRGELPGVIREVAAGLFPGARPLRFSPGALQSLLAWTWPGNVAELRDVLAGLPTAARTGLVQVQHLPPALRQAAGPRLSRYEQSERETIVAALRDAEWNKSRAAEILGIGRTTLYRKIRSLRIEEET